MPRADVGCDEHHLLDEQTESTRVGIGKKKILFGICLSMAVVMIGLGAKMMTSSKLNDRKSADTSAVLMGTDPNHHGFNAAFAKKDTMLVGVEDDGEEDEEEELTNPEPAAAEEDEEEDEQKEVTNPEHVAASFPSTPFDGIVVEYECTTGGGCKKKSQR